MDQTLKALTEATAGAVGGVVSTTLLYPLDTCKTKFQAEANADGAKKYSNLLDVLREAVACGKVMSLYQGLATKNGHAIVSGFIYFYSYTYIRNKYLHNTGSTKMGTVANLVVAAAAGACTACAVQPLDTLSARMQTSKPGEAKGLWELLREGGIQRAYDGLGISLILTCNPAIQYTVFEQLKTRLLDQQQARQALNSSVGTPVALSALMAFVLGAVSKCVATVLTYPLIRCKVLMQRAETSEERERRKAAAGAGANNLNMGPPMTMAQAFRVIWHSEGVPGFYKGLRAQILKTVLAAALMLMIKEKVSEGSRLTVLALHKLLLAGKQGNALLNSMDAQTLNKTVRIGSPLATPTHVPAVAAAAAASPSIGAIASSIRPSSGVPSIPMEGRTRRGGIPQVELLATDEGTV